MTLLDVLLGVGFPTWPKTSHQKWVFCNVGNLSKLIFLLSKTCHEQKTSNLLRQYRIEFLASTTPKKYLVNISLFQVKYSVSHLYWMKLTCDSKLTMHFFFLEKFLAIYNTVTFIFSTEIFALVFVPFR